MPVLVIAIALLGIVGSFMGGGPNSSQPTNSNVIVSSPTGGLIRPGQNISPGQTTIQSEPSTTESISTPPESEPEPLLPVVATISAQDVDYDRSRLRGEITFPGAVIRGDVYFEFGTSKAIVTTQDDEMVTLAVKSNITSGGDYSYRVTGLEAGTQYYYRFCFADDLTERCGSVDSFETVEVSYNRSNYRAPSVTTSRARNLNGEEATLYGSFRQYSAKDITVFFVYGESKSLVTEVPFQYEVYSDVREQDEKLQRVRISGAESGKTISRLVDELEEDTTHYFRLCVAYDDIFTGIKCGSVRNFKTKDRQRDNPFVGSQTALVRGTTVELSAFVDTEDYRNNRVFAVYGTDYNRIQSVSSKSSFHKISQSGDLLQKVSIETKVSKSGEFKTTAENLLPDKKYYYRFCVGYAKEDDYDREVFVVTCDGTESFWTE